MMKIIQIPVLQDNYEYLVICEKTGKAAIVDAPDASATRNAVKKAGVELTAICDTHHRWDHTGANEDLLSKQNLIVYGGANDRGRIFGQTHFLKEGDTVRLGKLSFSILDLTHSVYCFPTLLYRTDWGYGSTHLSEMDPLLLFDYTIFCHIQISPVVVCSHRSMYRPFC